jgi:aspartate racemase
MAPRPARIGLLATAGTYHAGTYPLALAPRGFEVVLPSPAMREEAVQPAIYDPDYGIKARGHATERATAGLMAAIRSLKAAGVEATILGCTELPLAFPEGSFDDMPFINPTLILARALIREANPDKLRPKAVAEPFRRAASTRQPGKKPGVRVASQPEAG